MAAASELQGWTLQSYPQRVPFPSNPICEKRASILASSAWGRPLKDSPFGRNNTLSALLAFALFFFRPAAAFAHSLAASFLASLESNTILKTMKTNKNAESCTQAPQTVASHFAMSAFT